jgi:hypothetical protein
MANHNQRITLKLWRLIVEPQSGAMEANLLAMEANFGALMTLTGTLDSHTGDMEARIRAVDLFRLSLK